MKPPQLAEDDLKSLRRLVTTYGRATILKALAKRPGRPKRLRSHYFGLALTIDYVIEEHMSRGLDERAARTQAMKDALIELSREDSRGNLLPDGRTKPITPTTVARYYRWALNELRDGEIRIALEIDAQAAKQGVDGLELAHALPEHYGGVTWLRYKRGKAALNAVANSSQSPEKKEP